jgi:hypothetical protein
MLSSLCHKRFGCSNAVGPPTFVLTFRTKSYEADDQALKRGSGTFADSAMRAIIFKTKLSALRKSTWCYEVLARFRCVYGDSSIRNEAFHPSISFFGVTLTLSTFPRSKQSSTSDIQNIPIMKSRPLSPSVVSVSHVHLMSKIAPNVFHQSSVRSVIHLRGGLGQYLSIWFVSN